MAIKRWNANTSTWELVGTPGTVTPASIGAAALVGNNTFNNDQTIQGALNLTGNSTNKINAASKFTVDTSNTWGAISLARQSGQIDVLKIQGTDSTGTANSLRLVNASGNGSAIDLYHDSLRFYVEGTTTERMRIDASGNIGVGTSSPATAFLDPSGNNVTAKLIDVQPGNNTYGGIVVGTARTYSNNTTNRQGYFVRRADGWNTSRTGMWKGSDALSSNLEYWERLIFNNDGGDASIAFATNLNERMRITTAGRVSINTSTELCALNVAGTGTVSGGIAHYYDVANYPNMRGWVEHIGQAGGFRIVSQGANLGGDASGSISFWNSNSNSASPSTDAAASEKMRLIPAGYLLIGYTGSNGAYRLQVNSQIFATSSSIATSDGRYKENVLPITSGLDIIDSLNPVSFNWKEHPVHNFVPGKTVGFIAQEVKEALKDYEWVDNIIKTNNMEAVLDEEGNEITPAEEFLGIAESNIIPLLVAAVKELRVELNTLKSSML